MCRHVHVSLSAEEQAATRRLSGFLIPAYASVAVAMLAAVLLFQQPKQGELIAAVQPPASQHAEQAR